MAWMDANNITSPDARAEILDLGAVEPAELTDLEDDDIAELCDKMKKLEANRFRKAIEVLKGVGGTSAGVAATSLAAVESARGSNWWDVFISHAQAESGQQSALLAELLIQKGLKVWHDQRGECTFGGIAF